MNLKQEVQRRRTFAIIAHPDAGKTTLTEKLLLYAGAVQLAGSVTARKQQRATVSDWMELERKRGISISSTVLRFDYRDFTINLLDTPGHRDFSEDTYRVLTAVDNAVMLLDAAKGVEPETKKLFQVCRQRGLPIFTFINKMDRPARDPISLLDELENVLGLHACPMNWPIGSGPDFQGVVDRQNHLAHLFSRTVGGASRAPVELTSLDALPGMERVNPYVIQQATEELELLRTAALPFDAQAVLEGNLSPVFFGSAMNNFGVQLLWDGFLKHSSPPTPRRVGQQMIAPDHDAFSGFVFKIQANMNPRHRDRMAFVRIVSGRMTRGMDVTHSNAGDTVNMSSMQTLMGRERETLDEGFPGDIVAISGFRELGIGDTLTSDPAVVYDEIPRFPPECFAVLRNVSMAQSKQFSRGIDQLLQEGVVQSFTIPDRVAKEVVLGAVGPLQFDVVRYRLESEYNVVSQIDAAPWQIVRWLKSEEMAQSAEWRLPSGAVFAKDSDGNDVLLFESEWQIRFFEQNHAGVQLSKLPPAREAPADPKKRAPLANAG